MRCVGPPMPSMLKTLSIPPPYKLSIDEKETPWPSLRPISCGSTRTTSTPPLRRPNPIFYRRLRLIWRGPSSLSGPHNQVRSGARAARERESRGAEKQRHRLHHQAVQEPVRRDLGRRRRGARRLRNPSRLRHAHAPGDQPAHPVGLHRHREQALATQTSKATEEIGRHIQMVQGTTRRSVEEIARSASSAATNASTMVDALKMVEDTIRRTQGAAKIRARTVRRSQRPARRARCRGRGAVRDRAQGRGRSERLRGPQSGGGEEVGLGSGRRTRTRHFSRLAR